MTDETDEQRRDYLGVDVSAEPPVVVVGDDEVFELSYERQLCLATQIAATIMRQIPGASSSEATACANNIVAGIGEYGMVRR